MEPAYDRRSHGRRPSFLVTEFNGGHGTFRPVCEKLMEKGVLAKDAHEKTVRFAPPLVITRDEVDWAIEKTKEVFEKA